MLKSLLFYTTKTYLLLLIIFLNFCRPTELSNPCDPNSSDYNSNLFLKLALGDASPSCGFQQRTSNPNASQAVSESSSETSSTDTQSTTATTATSTFTISGNITGLLSYGLVLQNNSNEDLILNYGTTSFSFSTKVTDYIVSVKTQPRFHTCTVSNGSGRASSDVTNVTVSCSPKQPGYLIVSNVTSKNISVYSISSSSGTLTEVAGSPFSTTATCFPRGLGLSPDANFLYAACQGEDKIRAYSVSKSNGSLSEISGSPFSIPSGSPSRVAIDPSGKWLVVGTNNPSTSIHMYSINATSGVPSFLASYATSGIQPYTVTFDASGKFVYAGLGSGANTGNVDGWILNSSTGALTSVGASVAGGSNAIEITTDPAGRYLYAANYLNPGRVFVYNINTTTGILTPIAGLGAGFSTTNASPDSIIVDPKNRFVYVANQTPANLAGFTIDSSTGGLTAMGGSPFTGFSGALAMDPGGNYLYSGSGGNVRAFSINSSTGEPTLIGTVTAGDDQTKAVIASY